jgi:hypothetical protein
MSQTISIQFDLSPGERLLWSGAPRQGLMLRQEDGLMIPFSLLWGGGAVFWNAQVWRTHGPSFFKLWGIPFLGIAAYIMVGRFFYDAWMRSRTAYGLTTERILISAAGLAPSLKSLDLRTLPTIMLTERPDGSGTIAFGPIPEQFAWARRRATQAAPAFEAIPGAKAVYEQIRTAQRDARAVAS